MKASRIPPVATAAICVAIAVAGIAGCSSSPSATGQSATYIETHDAVGYSTLAQLRQAADSVAILQPTGETSVVMVSGIPWTLSTVNLVKQLSGTQLPASFQLRQLGEARTSVAFSLVSSDDAYIAYLQGFKTLSQSYPGQYVVIGGLQGLFVRAGVSSSGVSAAEAPDSSYSLVDPDNTSLPQQITVAQAQAS